MRSRKEGIRGQKEEMGWSAGTGGLTEGRGGRKEEEDGTMELLLRRMEISDTDDEARKEEDEVGRNCATA